MVEIKMQDNRKSTRLFINYLLISGWRLLRYINDRIHVPFQKYIISNFRQVMPTNEKIESLFDFSRSYSYLGTNIAPLQNKLEFIDFYNYVLNNLKPVRTIVEIGTAKGGTLFLFTQMLEEDGLVISLDRYKFPQWKVNLFHTFSRKGANISIVTGDSSHDSTIHNLEHILKNRKVDLLFIDAAHTYESVKNDFEKFSKFVRSNGMIAFHDIKPGVGNGVPRFFSQLKETYDFNEFKVPEDDWGGIGAIIYK